MTNGEDVYFSIAEFFAVLSDSNRIKILYAISSQAMPVNDIIAAVGLSQTNVSRHLATLYKARMVSRRKEGKSVFYQLRNPALLDLCKSACDCIAVGIGDAHILKQALLDSSSAPISAQALLPRS